MKTDPVKETTGAPLPWVFDGDFVVVDCPRGSYPTVCRPLNEADGNVIAAATELYVLLDEIFNYLTGHDSFRDDWLKETQEALAKARGEPGA